MMTQVLLPQMKTDEEEEDIDDVMERGKVKETHHKVDDKDDEEKRNETGLKRVARFKREDDERKYR